MDKTIKVQCPAKVNLSLKVVGKRPDGFHNIESIMQTIDLFDMLTITFKPSPDIKISLSGNSDKISYDETNLVYKAAKLFMDKTGHTGEIAINIEKNIPVSAGLAGGSSDGAGTIFGLNELFKSPLTQNKMHELCASLGSDLNVCLQGGRLLATSRGEVIKPLDYEEMNINLIKPNGLEIRAKEAYIKFSQKQTNLSSKEDYVNDLEWAIIDDYPQLRHIKQKYPSSVMTGSGSAYFSVKEVFLPEKNYIIYNGHKTIPYGVKIIE